MPLPPQLRGNAWTQKTAVLMLPILVSRAHTRRSITYGELDKWIVSRNLGHHVHAAVYGKPAGAIGEALFETGKKWGVSIPCINALVVNQRTGLPGSGCDWFMQRYLRKPEPDRDLCPEDRKAVAEEVHRRVFDFERWDELLGEYGLRPLPNDPPRHARHPGPVAKRGWSSEGESEAHRRLVEFVATDPSVLSLSWTPTQAVLDHLFLSGDRPDVALCDDAHFLAVEVKSCISNDDDVERGIYQCVKYRALGRAEQLTNRDIPNARSLLVVGRRVRKAILDLAELHDVRVVLIIDAARGSA